MELPISEVLALALAVAASPFAIIPAILVLFTDRPRATSLAYLAGWLVGLVVGATAFVLLAGVIELGDEPTSWSFWARIVIGLALVVLGIRKWTTRSTASDLPAWMSSIESLRPPRAFALATGLALVNPKILLLTAAAGAAIGAGTDGAYDALSMVALYAAVGALSVALPVLAFLVLGDRVMTTLKRGRDWLERNNAAVMAVVMVVIGLVLVRNGYGGL